MRLLFLTSSAPFGKSESFVISEANAIAKLGHEVILVPTLIRKGKPNNFQLHNNIRVLAEPLLSFKFLSPLLCFIVFDFKLMVKLFLLIRDRNILNSLKNFVVIPKSIWLSNYIKKNPVDHIHAHWLTTPSTLAMLVGEITGIPWSVTGHRGDIVANNSLRNKYEKAKFIRFISESGKRLAASRVEVLEQKTFVLHLGINLDENNSVECLTPQKHSGSFNIVCPANLIPVKGHQFLIDSVLLMKHKNHIKLFIVGDGELRQELEDRVKALNLQSSIVFFGHVAHSELLSWYRTGEINAVVLPSLDLGNGLHEGIPVSLMEAMAFKIPIISTRTGAYRNCCRKMVRCMATWLKRVM